MPPPGKTRQMPGYSPNFGAESMSVSFSNWKLFLPEYENRIEFMRPTYDRDKPQVTVVRPKPCAAYPEVGGDFMPYRLDPGGRNYFGFWMPQLLVADRIGNPATTFIVHRPTWAGGVTDYPNATSTPLSVLLRAVVGAIRKGQHKDDSWRRSVSRPKAFEPNADMILEWTGTRGGDTGEMKSLKAPKQMFFMQAVVPQHDGKIMWGPDKPPVPGLGEKTCVVGLTEGAGKSLLELCNQERDNYRGDPADFESRYVNGDPVSVTGGRYLYIYPKGGDPRQTRMQSVPADYDPLSNRGGSGSRGRGGKSAQGGADSFDGYDMHFDTTFDNQPAALIRANYNEQQRRAMVDYLKHNWLYWEDIFDFPDERRQVTMLSEILPLSMIDYAFTGEHDEWITADVRRRIDESKAVRIPSAPSRLPASVPPPQGVYTPPAHGQSPPSAQAAYDPLASALSTPADWNRSPQQLPTAADPFPPGSTPFDGLPTLRGGATHLDDVAVLDAAVVQPGSLVSPDMAAGSVDSALAGAAEMASSLFGQQGAPAPSGAAALAAAKKKQQAAAV